MTNPVCDRVVKDEWRMNYCNNLTYDMVRVHVLNLCLFVKIVRPLIFFSFEIGLSFAKFLTHTDYINNFKCTFGHIALKMKIAGRTTYILLKN